MNILELLRQVLAEGRRRRDAEAGRLARVRICCAHGDHRVLVSEDLEPDALWTVCVDCGWCDRLGSVHAVTHQGKARPRRDA